MNRRTFAIIGLGRFGMQALKVLSQEPGISILAIDRNQKVIDFAQQYATEALVLDCTVEEALVASGIADVDSAVVSIGENSEVNIMTVAILVKLGVPEIIARATSQLHKQILERIGATRVVIPEEDIATRIAHSIIRTEVRDSLDLGESYTLEEISICPTNAFVGKSIKEIGFRAEWNVNLVMMRKKRGGITTHHFPKSDYVFVGDEVVLVVGEIQNIRKFEEACQC